MNILLILVGVLVLSAVTWVLYLAIMNLAQNRHQLTSFSKAIAYPILAVGIVFDIAFNMIVGTIAFVEPPMQLLFTDRCKKHIDKQNWRGDVARWFCRNLLDPFDESESHCR